MSRQFDPKLNKKLYLAHADCRLFTVNGLAVRNASKSDEEFGNFALHDEFPDIIGEREVWISEKLAPREGVFFAANTLTYLARVAAGAIDQAYTEGLDAERALRESVNGVVFRDGKPHARVPAEIYQGEYVTLPDPKGTVSVRLVDGNLTRSYYKTDYTQGGHGYVYRWVPRAEIWIENGADHRELPFIICHEYLERRLMRDAGLGYDRAHEIASALEFDLRRGKGLTTLLSHSRGKIGKRDLPKLTDETVYEFVNAHYRQAGQRESKS
jgi:hypothetical protein